MYRLELAYPTAIAQLFGNYHPSGGRYRGVRPDGGNAKQGDPKLNQMIEAARREALGGVEPREDGGISEHFGLDEWQKGFAVSNVLIGCMFGAAMAGALGDHFGRRRGLQLSAVLFLVSAVGCVFPRSLAELVAARFVGGLGVGMASLLSPLYIAEVAPARIRGRLVSLNQIAIISGMVVVSVVNWWIASPSDESWNVATGWRWMFGSEIAPAASPSAEASPSS